MHAPERTTLEAILTRRNLSDTRANRLTGSTPILLYAERMWDVTIAVEGDPRLFRVYPGWVQVTQQDGQVTVERVDTRFLHNLPAPVVSLAGLLAGQIWRISRAALPHTRAAQLRFLAATMQDGGWYRTPESLYVSSGGFSYHWSCPAHWKEHGFSQIQWDRLAALSGRYRRFVHYVREVSPQWREERRIAWADNSTDVVEVNRFGHRRTRQFVGPGGDACF